MKDLKEAAGVALTECMDVKRGENVVVVIDEPQRKIGQAFWERARELGADAILCEMLPRETNGEEPPKAVAGLLASCDVFIIPTSKSLSHTDARRKASANGARGATLPGITEEAMKRSLKADYRAIEARTKKIAPILSGADEARVITALGTDITMSLKGRSCHEDHGMVRSAGEFTNLPAGEAYLAPLEGTAMGRIVVDGSAAGVGIVKDPITLVVEDGYAIDITGGTEAEKLKEITEKFGKDGRNIAELGVGTNDKAILTGLVLEDEKVMGTVHIAIGDNASMGGRVSVQSHLDLVIKSPTLIVDGRELIKEGKLLV